MKEQMLSILLNYIGSPEKAIDARTELLNLIDIAPHSFGIVRWYDNKYEDVVCLNKAIAEEYVRKYNELAGEEKCYIDNNVWLPLSDA